MEQLLNDLIGCFETNTSAKDFVLNLTAYILSPKLSVHTVYRIIVLKDDSEGKWSSRFDPTRVSGVLSWSKSINGTKKYIEGWKDPAKMVIIKGEVIGFDLIEFAEEVLKTKSENLHLKSEYYRLQRKLDNFGYHEEEILSTEVVSFEIIDEYLV